MAEAVNIEAARGYARLGIPVFPVWWIKKGGCACGRADCEHPGKHPITASGFKDATTSPATVRRWWKRYPDANIGAVCGAESGIVALDVDPRNGGEESLAELEKKNGKIPEGPRSLTGGGGLHILFRHPGGHVAKAVNIRPGLDLQADDSYVIFPPSNHVSGGLYGWEVPLKSLKDLPLIPAWLLKLASSRRARHKTAPGESEPIPKGQRNEALASIAGRLRRAGASQGAILTQLRQESEARCQPPLSDYEIEAVAKSIAGYEPAEIEKPARLLNDKERVDLFGDVVDFFRRHFYFEKAWHYVIVALFVLQAQVATVLPAVFYLFIGGPFGRGKTALLNLLVKLTNGLLFENVSIARLARSMENGRTICLDEIDIDRGKEYNEISDALLRTGYKADAAPYARWDATKKAADDIPIYGPKAGTFRGEVEEALQSRGYIIPTAKVKGEAGFDYVLANMWPELGDLPERLNAWGEYARKAFREEWVKKTAHTTAFREKVRKAVPELGANRDSELGAMAVLVAEMIRVDVIEELREASELAKTLTGEGLGDLLGELAEIVLEKVGPLQESILEDSPVVRLSQKELKDELNRRRKERQEPVLLDRDFAKLRRDFEVKDEWLRRPKNRIVWNLPLPFLRGLEDMANSPIPPNPNEEPGQGVEGVSHVSHVSHKEEEEKVLAKVFKRNVGGPCDLCKSDGENVSIVAPRGSHEMVKVCPPCAETRFDFGPPPGVSKDV